MLIVAALQTGAVLALIAFTAMVYSSVALAILLAVMCVVLLTLSELLSIPTAGGR